MRAWTVVAFYAAALALLHLLFAALARRGFLYWPGTRVAEPPAAAADAVPWWLDGPLAAHLGRPEVVLPAHATVADAVAGIRAAAPGEASYVYVVDAAQRLRGTVSALRLVTSAPDVHLGVLIDGAPVTLSAGHRLSDALDLLRRHGLRAVPVTDPAGRMLGVVGPRP